MQTEQTDDLDATLRRLHREGQRILAVEHVGESWTIVSAPFNGIETR